MKKITSVFTLLLAILLIAGLFAGCGDKTENYSSDYSSYDSSSYSSDTMDHDTYCMLYMNITDVKVSHSGNYTYVTGTIKNNGTYNIKYVKVKASCKDSYGSVVDTDWTYAVDSAWLDAGESKNFEMMIRDENWRISTADVKIMYD